MKTFKEFLSELSSAILSRYIRKADDETEEPKRDQHSNDWDKVHRRVQGATLAKLKIRKRAVKVPAGRASHKPVKASIALKGRRY